jgi:hypothetical protein
VVPLCNTSSGQLFTTTAGSFHSDSENNGLTEPSFGHPTIIEQWVIISQIMNTWIGEILSTTYNANNLTEIEIQIQNSDFVESEGTLFGPIT